MLSASEGSVQHLMHKEMAREGDTNMGK